MNKIEKIGIGIFGGTAIATAILLSRMFNNSAKVLKGAAVGSGFGYRILFGSKEFHNGIDLSAKTGTPILCPLDGEVINVWQDTMCGTGVRILHEKKGIHTGYCHLSKVLVRKGQKIKAGEKIGLVGSTGRSTGPHLHFVVFSIKLQKYIDPAKVKFINLT
ncbi:MAG: M23 family metallopeptidase [Bacteroidales bacterium]|jgi:murein DD-endopeptidase MepM/ murein hydrolase activator NlpD|nr:M23 family metallopeptidase [Bacteroidales bacterium]